MSSLIRVSMNILMNGHCSKDIVISIVYTYNHGKFFCIYKLWRHNYKIRKWGSLYGHWGGAGYVSYDQVSTWQHARDLPLCISFDDDVFASYLKSHGHISLVKVILTDCSANFHRFVQFGFGPSSDGHVDFV